MEIIRLDIDALTPDPNNAKEHPKWQVDQIVNSIERFGNLDPIGIWGDDNLIVEGHGRYEALKALGYTEAECIRLDWLTEEERKAYALAHNKLTMNSDFLPEALTATLNEIGDIDMSLFGFEVEVPDEIELPPIMEDTPPDTPPSTDGARTNMAARRAQTHVRRQHRPEGAGTLNERRDRRPSHHGPAIQCGARSG